MNFFKLALFLFYPPMCGICGKTFNSENYICNDCKENINKYLINLCDGEKFFIYNYKEYLRKIFLQYKFNEKNYLSRSFAQCVFENKKVCDFLKRYDIITPVPLHFCRLNQRGYNQSELILRELFNMYNNNNNSENFRKM